MAYARLVERAKSHLKIAIMVPRKHLSRAIAGTFWGPNVKKKCFSSTDNDGIIPPNTMKHIWRITRTTYCRTHYQLPLKRGYNLGSLCFQFIILSWYFDDLVQGCSNSSALTIASLQFCAKPSICILLKIIWFVYQRMWQGWSLWKQEPLYWELFLDNQKQTEKRRATWVQFTKQSSPKDGR